MKTKDFVVRDATIRAHKRFDKVLGHDRCYSITYLSHDEETEYHLPFYPESATPVYMGEVIMKGKKNFQVTYSLDESITWTCNQPTFSDALNKMLDMFIVDHLHKTMIEYNVYTTVTDENFYKVEENGYVWLYYINEQDDHYRSELVGSYLIGQFSDGKAINYIERVGKLGADHILSMLAKIKSTVRER